MDSIIKTQKTSEGILDLMLDSLGIFPLDCPLHIKLRVCGDARCNCGAANIQLITETNLGSSEIEFNIPIDVHKKIVHSCNHKEYFSKENLEEENTVTQLLSNSFSPKDWSTLEKQYLNYKFIISEQIEAEKIEYDFGKEEYKNPELMFKYHHIFPCSSFFEIDGNQEYEIFDTYCKNPTCDCSSIKLELFQVTKEKKKNESIGNCWYNYKSQTIEVEGSQKEKITKIITSLLQQYEHIDNIFHRRNQILRRLFQKGLANYVKTLNKKKITPKISRNDLCLCGSGKKYKKCCMNSAERFLE